MRTAPHDAEEPVIRDLRAERDEVGSKTIGNEIRALRHRGDVTRLGRTRSRRRRLWIATTVGIVSPQFVGDGLEYQKSNREDPTVRDMLRGMRSGFNELLLRSSRS